LPKRDRQEKAGRVEFKRKKKEKGHVPFFRRRLESRRVAEKGEGGKQGCKKKASGILLVGKKETRIRRASLCERRGRKSYIFQNCKEKKRIK